MEAMRPTHHLRQTMPTEGKGLLASAPAPILERTDHDAPSVFRPENLLREARRQKGLGSGPVPPICLLDPDGDVVRHVRRAYDARQSAHWACYHTDMWEWEDDGERYGVVGRAVGSSFAVLVAEQLFVSGCELLLSLTSAGQIVDLGPPPYHIVIERALRDEGTSYHYLPPSQFVEADPSLLTLAEAAFDGISCSVHHGASWTTDAPFRETERSIAERRQAGALAVEMEAAALYAFARACGKPILCLAHVTNQLGCVEGDFEKGDHDGAADSLVLVQAFSAAWRSRQRVFDPRSRT